MTDHALAERRDSTTGERPGLLDELRIQVERGLDRYLPPEGDIALGDFSLNPNVGNHLMWIAVMRYLRSRGRRVGYVAHHANYSGADLRRAIGRGPILILGGAGMSGLWPLVRDMRHQMISECRDNPVVILPQTVIFRDVAEQGESQAVVDKHPNITVLARDEVSLAVAQRTYSQARVAMVPDLALMLPAQRRKHRPIAPACWLARIDIEASGATAPTGFVRFDWAHLTARQWPVGYGLMRASGALSRVRSRSTGGTIHDLSGRSLVWLYERISETLLRTGNSLADHGAVFVTDRLHGHVLGVLRGQPTVLLPDAFGKNRAIFDSYTHRFSNVFWAETPSEALATVKRLTNS
jgi:pyruvyl transferase EpsO